MRRLALRFFALVWVIACTNFISLAHAQTNVDDYVVVAEESMTIGRATLFASGNAGVSAAAGRASFGPRVLAVDGVNFLVDEARIRRSSSFFRFWANSVDLSNNVEFRDPLLHPNSETPISFPPPALVSFPGVPAISPGSGQVDIPARATVTLPPGSYGDLRLRRASAVIFTGGTYNLDKLILKRQARLFFTAPTTLNVATFARSGRGTIIGPLGPSVNANDIHFNFGGRVLRFSARSTVAARVNASGSRVVTGIATLIRGQLVGQQVRLGRANVIQSVNLPVSFDEFVPSETPTPTETSTGTITPTETPTPTDTPTGTPLPSDTPTETPTGTPLPTETPTETPTQTDTPTESPTETPTETTTPTETATEIPTDSPVPTDTSTETPTESPLPTDTPTETPTETETPTNTPTRTPTRTHTPTNTPTNTPTRTPTSTNTPTRTPTVTPLPTNTPTRTPTVTSLPTNTPTVAGTPCSAGLSVHATTFDQVEFITEIGGGTVTQVGGSGAGGAMTTGDDFQGTVSASTGVSVSMPSYVFASSVVASDLSGTSEPGNVASVVLGAPTDITFTAPGNGGPDGTAGDGSLVMSSAGNFITLSFNSTLCSSGCSPQALVLFTDTAGAGTATVDLLLSGATVASVSTSVPGGAVGSGMGGVALTVNGVTFDAVRISRNSGTVEIDAVAVLASLGDDCGEEAGSIALCGDGVVQGGEECDDGNGESGDGCSSSCRTEDEIAMGSRFCTLTQGGWGAPGGIANGPNGFLTENPQILPATIGGPDYSTTIHTQEALIEYLPKGGVPDSLFPGTRNFHTAGDVTNDGGGVLAGQTLTLTLALRLSASGATFDNFDSFLLPELAFCTQALSAGDDDMLGTSDDELDTASPISGPWTISGELATANNSVSDLLDIANQYLRNEDSTAATISEVNDALTILNEAFHECRQVVACP